MLLKVLAVVAAAALSADAQSSCPYPGRRFTTGDSVMLASGVTDSALPQGSVGTITEDDHNDPPYKVRGPDEVTGYLREDQVRCPTPAAGADGDRQSGRASPSDSASPTPSPPSPSPPPRPGSKEDEQCNAILLEGEHKKGENDVERCDMGDARGGIPWFCDDDADCDLSSSATSACKAIWDGTEYFCNVDGVCTCSNSEHELLMILLGATGAFCIWCCVAYGCGFCGKSSKYSGEGEKKQDPYGSWVWVPTERTKAEEAEMSEDSDVRGMVLGCMGFRTVDLATDFITTTVVLRKGGKFEHYCKTKSNYDYDAIHTVMVLATVIGTVLYLADMVLHSAAINFCRRDSRGIGVHNKYWLRITPFNVAVALLEDLPAGVVMVIIFDVLGVGDDPLLWIIFLASLGSLLGKVRTIISGGWAGVKTCWACCAEEEEAMGFGN